MTNENSKAKLTEEELKKVNGGACDLEIIDQPTDLIAGFGIDKVPGNGEVYLPN